MSILYSTILEYAKSTTEIATNKGRAYSDLELTRFLYLGLLELYRRFDINTSCVYFDYICPVLSYTFEENIVKIKSIYLNNTLLLDDEYEYAHDGKIYFSQNILQYLNGSNDRFYIEYKKSISMPIPSELSTKSIPDIYFEAILAYISYKVSQTVIAGETTHLSYVKNPYYQKYLNELQILSDLGIGAESPSRNNRAFVKGYLSGGNVYCDFNQSKYIPFRKCYKDIIPCNTTITQPITTPICIIGDNVLYGFMFGETSTDIYGLRNYTIQEAVGLFGDTYPNACGQVLYGFINNINNEYATTNYGLVNAIDNDTITGIYGEIE